MTDKLKEKESFSVKAYWFWEASKLQFDPIKDRQSWS